MLLPDDDDETTRTPNDILKDPAARNVFKRDGVGGPLVRAVIAALTELNLADFRSTGRLTAACQAYLSAA